MSHERSNPLVTVLAGIGIGAVAMYFLDAARGTRRRHVVGDKTKSALRSGRRALHDAVENVKNHTRGTVVETRARLHEERVDDVQLIERVRAELGHHVGHARAIEVYAEDGNVLLCGAVPVEEIAEAERTTSAVRGVRCVDNQLASST